MKSTKDRVDYWIKIVFIVIVICIQMNVVIPATQNITVAGDMIFTYTLANNSYSPLFFNKYMIDAIPNSNGWFDAEILREWYLVNDYNRFNYSGVYWHQRIDVHPPLYYMLVHTICSFFPNTYSNLYAGTINILGILFIDLLLALLFHKLYNNYVYASLPMLLLLLQGGFASQILNLRMYIMFAAVCFWYLYIHIVGELDGWTLKRTISYVICIVVGCLTHNYFYVYAFCVSLIQVIRFIYKKAYYTLINYLMCGLLGIMMTLIIFPWMIWQVIFNQQGKHSEISTLNVDGVRELLLFIDKYWFSKQSIVIIFSLFLCFISVKIYRKNIRSDVQNPEPSHRFIWIHIICSTCLYLVMIYTLDGGRDHYNMPEYIPVLLILSVFILWIINTFVKDWRLTLPLLLLFGISMMGNQQKTLYEYFETVRPANDEWNRIAEENKDCDCIYVGLIDELHIMNYSFYQVAQYDEVKAVAEEEYVNSNLSDLLKGRKTASSDIIMYISEDLDIPEGTELLMNWKELNCVYLEMNDE